MPIEKLHLGTIAWFEMVGQWMSDAAARATLPPALNVSLIERYMDGIEVSEGLVQGIRFDIIGGQPSFRIGVRPEERGDITIEITIAAAQKLNSFRRSQPEYAATLDQFLSTGKIRVDGDISRIGSWLDAVHDPIVDRTI